MLAFGSVTHVALVSLPGSSSIVNIQGRITAMATMRPTSSFTAPITARATVGVRLRAPGGASVVGKIRVNAEARAQGGFNLPSCLSVGARARAQGGFNLASRMSVGARARAPGGFNLASQLSMGVRVRAPGGASVVGVVKTRTGSSAPGGMTTSGRLSMFSRELVNPTPIRQDNPLRLPLLTSSGPAFWPGQSGIIEPSAQPTPTTPGIIMPSTIPMLGMF